MMNGRQTLGELNQAENSLRQELNTANQTLEQATKSLASNAKEQTATYIELARIRLSELLNSDTLSSLEHLESRISNLLSSRQQSLDDIAQRIHSVQQELTVINASSDAKLDDIENVIQKITDLEESLNQNLLDNKNYQSQLEESEKLARHAESAREKVQFANEDYRKKARAYTGEKLFMYLWERQYGTQDYKANNFIRYLDNWVAGLCDYDKARVNYWNLLEIPKRLESHAAQLQASAEAAETALQSLELEARKTAGILELDQQLEAAENDKDSIDQRVNALREKLDALEQEEIAFASGDDAAMGKCLQLIADTLKRRDIHHLHEMSLATATSEDDQLVITLEALKDEQEETQEYIRTLKRSRTATLKQLGELESVKRNFKKRHYDDSRSSFGNDRLIKVAVNGLIEGLITGAEVWSTIERNRRQNHDYYGGKKHRTTKKRYRDPFKHNKHRSRSKRYASSKSKGGFRTGGGF